jgi:hypothetical protein
VSMSKTLVVSAVETNDDADQPPVLVIEEA